MSESGAHLGGSHVYGTPRPDSDLDLCVLVTAEEASLLGLLADEPNGLREGFGSFPVRYGRLNLIVCVDPEVYARWKQGRDELREQAPVSREQARATFKRLGVSNG